MNERADGALELQVFPSGQLGGDEQILRGMGSGTIHMGSNASSNMSIVSDAYSWADLPYVFKSAESAQAAFNRPGRERVHRRQDARGGQYGRARPYRGRRLSHSDQHQARAQIPG